MVAIPSATAVASPVWSTVAMFSSELAQLTSALMGLPWRSLSIATNCCVAPGSASACTGSTVRLPTIPVSIRNLIGSVRPSLSPMYGVHDIDLKGEADLCHGPDRAPPTSNRSLRPRTDWNRFLRRGHTSVRSRPF